jgi:hypothetical protein
VVCKIIKVKLGEDGQTALLQDVLSGHSECST